MVSLRSLRINPLIAPEGTIIPLMGNEAIARGALEGGVYVVTGYPGTPSSEVIMTLHRFGRDLDIYVEWAVNERVAFEIAFGASICGARSLVTMKSPGLNVALDPIVSAAYAGVEGGLVILVADDPGPHTTQTEEDSRWISKLVKIPTVSPSNPQEAKDFTKNALLLSEEVGLPIMLRTTTRVNHTIADVVLGKLSEPVKFRKLVHDPPRFVRAGMKWNLERHRWLNSKVKEFLGKYRKYFKEEIIGHGSIGIITEGVSFEYLMELLSKIRELNDLISILKLNIIYPIPSEPILDFIRDKDLILVIEELDPYLEEVVKDIVSTYSLKVKILGKEEGLLPLEGELSVGLIASALLRVLKISGVNNELISLIKKEIPPHVSIGASNDLVPNRPPPLCPGCPHRATYIAILEAIKELGYDIEKTPIVGDIGCYALSVNPPLKAVWIEHSMGASISIALGMKLSGFNGKVIATIGDSTFFHGGIQPLIEAVHKNVDLLVIILDNSVVAMTGHQSTPSWSVTESGRRASPISIINLVKALNISNVSIVDPYNVDKLKEEIKRLLNIEGVKVIIASRECALMAKRLGKLKSYCEVIDSKCVGCGSCVMNTGCPAIFLGNDGKAHIDTTSCTGCGLCMRYCRFNAIIRRGEKG